MTPTTPYRILLIDDQEAIHEDYRKILGVQSPTSAALGRAAAELFDDDPATCVDWEGFELSSAMQGQQGFELVQRSTEEGRPYAVAFVDIRMPPGWDGVETVCRIWEVDPEILVVICSAYSDYSWEEMVRKLGRNDRFLILKKPFDNIEVRQCAMALTERWSVSRTDVLTGLLNRRAFQGHLKLEWGRSLRKNLPLTCAMLDFDYFKRINDTLGHQAGDLVLKQMAHLLQTNCRTSDYVCRYGGEELCVLLPNADEAVAAAWAERARQAIEAALIMAGDRAVRVTASFGVSVRQGVNDTMEQMMDRADQALIVAKKLGRNRVMCATAIVDSAATLEQVRQHGALFQGVTARQVMTSPVTALPVDATVGQAVELLRQLRVTSAPVVDSQGVLMGVLSEKDVLCILPNQDAWTMSVERIMQRTFVSFEEDAPVDSICEFLSRVTVRRVFIVRAGAPVGVISQGNLLRWYRRRVETPETAHGSALVPPGREAARGRLIAGAETLAQCAAQLADNQTLRGEDPLVPVINGVARLQELIDEMLSRSQGAISPDVLASLMDSAEIPFAGFVGSPPPARD